MTTQPDQEFQTALGADKSYMMPVSPWFFTNLPGFNKNWLWRSDGLWDLRWEQVMEIQPEFVEILTWNDWGESNYINKVRQKELALFTSANAAINYAINMPHKGWLKFLPFYIAQYKAGGVAPLVTEEKVAAYYRPHPATACPSGGTTGNNRNFGQIEVPPEQLVEDNVFFAALLVSDADVTVTVSVGGNTQIATFTKFPTSGVGTAGVYQGAVPFGTKTGDVVVTVTRAGMLIAKASGGPGISATCVGIVQNWNVVAL
ncbi:glycoside hydrolase [Podospora didyma]|uniref:Glycoside hydrolase n=1 Tax=Podospora didyma TaxID=330526 RepID=A0AAE0NSE1_9PEZI|nr:glycoside hydrolase [Podospora didyma]